ncbi:hypothetical protein NDU88_004653 [Pleurodeles waltl]|uniref:Uncharacterized protein n=1 Tax=Pleurodeles waltl TaxID=8319 RepID=A0AAV7SJH7_PLEWA|nr:hypothetical protein NDU88_004653 [Pleurodeles waltl]
MRHFFSNAGEKCGGNLPGKAIRGMTEKEETRNPEVEAPITRSSEEQHKKEGKTTGKGDKVGEEKERELEENIGEQQEKEGSRKE